MESATLKLRAALAVFEEVAQASNQFWDVNQQLDETWKQSLWKGFLGQRRFRTRLRGLLKKLDQAVALAWEAHRADPDVAIVQESGHEPVEWAPDTVISSCYMGAGVINLYLGDFTAAESLFRLSEKYFPTSEVYLRLGGLYIAEGDPQKARRTFQKVLDQDPESEEAVQALSIMRQLEER